MWGRARPNRSLVVSLLAATALASVAGCDVGGIFGEKLVLSPLRFIQWQQLGDRPNFMVSFDLTLAVVNPSAATKINWIFGDGGAFVTAGLQTEHRYTSSGDYSVTAYLFDASGLVDTVTSTIHVETPVGASDPTPTTNAADVPVQTTLRWTPGRSAAKNVLYLSRNRAAVESATPAVRQGELTQPLFQPSDLEGGVTYFWRVDTVRNFGSTPGGVWTFSTEPPPETITDPVPADGELNAPISLTLTWAAGMGADSHDVYFGTDPDVLNAASQTDPAFAGNQLTSSFTPPTSLENGVDYYWRIDEVGAGGVTRGSVLHFRVADAPGAITDESPIDEATNVPIDLTISWTAGLGAVSHDVYFGTSRTLVETADTGDPAFKGNQNEATFSPVLVADTTYFWRIDEVGPGGVAKGLVRLFTTAAAPASASDFSPTDNAIEVSTTPTLTWTAGENADEHIVYFGPDREAVAAADSADDANVIVTNLDLGIESYPPGSTSPLSENTIYYWRVDETGPGGLAQGEVLTFTTINPSRASNPVPADGATNVVLNAALEWTPGEHDGPPDKQDVYLGTIEDAVTAADRRSSLFMGTFPGGAASIQPSSLKRNTTYFWRIDERYERDGSELPLTRGKIWTFTTVQLPPEKASNPAPADGAMNLEPDITLDWTPGDGANTHDVYFGEDEAVIGQATPNSPSFRGSFEQSGFAFLDIQPGHQYFWRIDEVNDAGTTVGDVWRFDTFNTARLVILPVADHPAGTTATVQIQAQDHDGHVDATFSGTVTLVATGAVQGAGPVTLLQGRGAVNISDSVPEPITLSLADASVVGRDISSTQSVVFWGPLDSFRVEREGGGLIGPQSVSTAFNVRIAALDSAGQVVQDFDEPTLIYATHSFVGGPFQLTAPLNAGILRAHPIAFTQSGTQVTITAGWQDGPEIGVSNIFRVDP